MGKEENKCVLCDCILEAPQEEVCGPGGIGSRIRWECEWCGVVAVEIHAFRQIENMKSEEPDKVAMLAAYACERHIHQDGDPEPLVIQRRATEEGRAKGDIEIGDGVKAMQEVFADVGERLDRALMNLARISKTPGDDVSMVPKAVLYAENFEAQRFIWSALESLGYIIQDEPRAASQGASAMFLSYFVVGFTYVSPVGWARVYELKHVQSLGNKRQGFVAMWFHPIMQPVYDDGIALGIRAAGYDPYRVGDRPSLRKICDQIIAEIRKSRFLVADVTGRRPAVAYEAGYARGLGLPVILTCRADKERHILGNFDARQYPHILWNDPNDLKGQLCTWIEATIPPPAEEKT